MPLRFSFLLAVGAEDVWVEVGAGLRGGALAAVVAAFLGGLPGNGGKGALEKSVVDDIALVIFAFDDPVAGVGFALSGVGEDRGGVEALRGVDEKRSARAKGVHQALLTALFCRQDLSQHRAHKRGIIGFEKVRKDERRWFHWIYDGRPLDETVRGWEFFWRLRSDLSRSGSKASYV
jgi:hypothetical protein